MVCDSAAVDRSQFHPEQGPALPALQPIAVDFCARLRMTDVTGAAVVTLTALIGVS